MSQNTEWQPMSTAPRDGFEFEALCNGVICEAAWDGESDRFHLDNMDIDWRELEGWRRHV